MPTILSKQFALTLVCVSVYVCAGEEPNRSNWLSTSDPREILRRSVGLEHRNEKLLKQYTFQEHVLQKQFQKDGSFRVKEDAVYDVLPLAGKQFRKKIEENGQPLKPEAARKEEERADKFLRDRRPDHETEASREAHHEKRQHESEELLSDLLGAYNFTLEGEETVAGKPTWRIHAEPNHAFHATSRAGKFLPHLHGTLWIDKEEYQWVKIEAEALDTISAGLGMLRLHRGSHLELEQTRINDEIWLPRHVHLYADARALVLISGRFDLDQQFSNYKKYVADAKIVGVSEPAPSDSEKH